MKNTVFVIAFALTTFIAAKSFAQVTTDSSRVHQKSDTTKIGSKQTRTGMGDTSNTETGTATTGSDNAAVTGTATGDIVSTISVTGYNNALATAIRTADLEVIKGEGPYTFFAPSDKSLTNANAADNDWLNDRTKLEKVIRKHTVKGHYTKADIIKALSAGKGKAKLTTIDGGTIVLQVNADQNLELVDAKGNTASVAVFDQQATNGVVHVINGILM